MAQEQQDKAQLPGEGDNWADKQEGHSVMPKTDAEHRERVVSLLQTKVGGASRFTDISIFANDDAPKPPYRASTPYWSDPLNSDYRTAFAVTSEMLSSYPTGFASGVASNQPDASLISTFGESSSNAVQRAQEKLKKAQQELQEALDVEQAMLELAQLREVRKSHNDLYGPDKDSRQTAAQQYLAFKVSQREQPAQ